MASSNLTAPKIRSMKGQKRIVCVTCYDATFAKLVDEHVDVALVGDSLGMVIQGLETTLPVTLDEVIYHTKAVARGLSKAHLVADLPFLTYQINDEEALRNAGRLVTEGRAQSVKLEGGVRTASAIARIVQAGIPVMGHVGLTPQSFHQFGGFKVQGRAEAAAQAVMADARAVQEAGAYSIVLEGVPGELAAKITADLSIPTIGIGASAACDGQVLVIYNMLGMNPDFKAKFVKKYDDLATRISDAISTYGAEVRAGTFPGDEHSFHS